MYRLNCIHFTLLTLLTLLTVLFLFSPTRDYNKPSYNNNKKFNAYGFNGLTCH